MNGASVSAIIVNFNGGQDLVSCVVALHADAPRAEILVVDNGSTDGSIEAIRERFPEVRIVTSAKNLGFAGGANLGASLAGGDILLFLNPDLFVREGCVDALVKALREGAGAAGPALFVEASAREEFGGVIDRFGYPASLTEPDKAIYVPGCALATVSGLFHRLDGFDQRYFMFAEDIDYCWRVLLSGHDVVVAPKGAAVHRGGAATPGGYGKSGAKKTPTTFRVAMRERNSLAMILKCSPSRWLPLLIPSFVIQTLLTAVGGLLIGNPRVFVEILGGLIWNVRECPRTLALRRQLARIPKGEQEAIRRMVRGSNKLRTLIRHGFPRFVDADRKRS